MKNMTLIIILEVVQKEDLKIWLNASAVKIITQKDYVKNVTKQNID